MGKTRLVEMTFDKKRHFKLNFNALADLEELLDESLFVAFSQNKIGLSTIRAILYCGLKWEDSTLTKDATGEMIEKYLEQQENSIDTLISMIADGLNASGVIGSAEVGKTESVVKTAPLPQTK